LNASFSIITRIAETRFSLTIDLVGLVIKINFVSGEMKEPEDKKMRRRSANFTKNEVAALMFLIKKYKNQIDSKLMGTNSNKMKDHAWKKIAEEFNSLPGTIENPRSASILRNKYNNLKKLSKHKTVKKYAPDFVIDDEGQSSSIHYEYEGDFDDMMELKEEYTENSLEKNQVLDRNSTFSDTEGSANSTPVADADVRKVVEPATHRASRGDITKQDLLDLQKRCFLEEHALKLQHMQEKHDRVLRIQEEEAEERLRQMREEHKLQLEILQLRKQCLLK
jgi:hypothetical protein